MPRIIEELSLGKDETGQADSSGEGALNSFVLRLKPKLAAVQWTFQQAPRQTKRRKGVVASQ